MAVTVASLQAVLDLDKSGFDRGIKTSTGLLEKIGSAGVDSAVGSIINSFEAAGRAAVDFGKDSIDASMNLEHQMSAIAAVMGKTKDEIEPLGGLISELALSPDMTVTTFEAADAIEMLAKNGLSMTDIMDGAAKATVALANATGGEFSQSADVATDVMALWNNEFRDADGNLKDMGRAVDRISAVVTNSKFDLNDFALALAQGGGVAAASGVEFDDFAAVIAQISPSFASGSDAGTSFKTMMQRLAAPTDKAKDLMAEMGFSAYDAAGNLLPMIDIVSGLNDMFRRMDEDTKAETLTEIFGSDAMRAAAALADTTRDDFAKLQAQMEQVNAADAAAERMDNLAGSIDILGGIVEDLKVQMGNELNPVLKEFLDNTLIPMATQYGPDLVESFANLVESVGNFITVAGEAGTVQPLVDSLSSMVDSTNALFASFSALGDALGINTTEASTLDAIINGLNIAIWALKQPIDQFTGWTLAWAEAYDAVAQAINNLKDPFASLQSWAGDAGDTIREKLADLLPGSPVPLAVGLSTVASELSALQSLGTKGLDLGMATATVTPGGGGAIYNNTYHLGGQSMTFAGQDRQAGIEQVLAMLRAQLEAA